MRGETLLGERTIITGEKTALKAAKGTPAKINWHQGQTLPAFA